MGQTTAIHLSIEELISLRDSLNYLAQLGTPFTVNANLLLIKIMAALSNVDFIEQESLMASGSGN